MFASVYLKRFTLVPFHFQIFTFGRLSFSTGSSLSNQVHQTPAGIFTTPGGTARINGSHSIMNYEQVLWYGQRPRGGLQLPGSVISTLTVNNMSSSAVYFCAAP